MAKLRVQKWLKNDKNEVEYLCSAQKSKNVGSMLKVWWEEVKTFW